MWIPSLTFANSDDAARTIVDKDTILAIDRKIGSHPSPNSLEEVHENLIYSGNQSTLRLMRLYTMPLNCKFNLRLYPFDNQICSVELKVPLHLNQSMRAILAQVQEDAKIDPTHYKYVGFRIDSDGSDGTGNVIKVSLLLKRQYTYLFASTFAPSVCLMMIACLSLFIDESHFEATIMVALTAKLVLFTLYQSISATLPITSYMKLIDIWLLTALMMPFGVILVLVTADLKNTETDDKEPNEGAEAKKGGGQSLISAVKVGSLVPNVDNAGKKPRRFSRVVRISQLMIPGMTMMFVIGFFAIGLSHDIWEQET